MKNIFLRICMMTVILILVVSCPVQQQNTDSKSITITGLGWFIYNIDSSYFSSTPSSHAFYAFYVSYSGSDISASDISNARISDPTNWGWDLDLGSLDPQKKVLASGFCYDGSAVNTLKIGNFKVEIKLKNGSVVSYTKSIPAPGSTTPNGFTSVYTEDTSKPSGGTPLIRRISTTSYGTILKDTANSRLSIPFKIDDSNVYNGWVWLFDSNKNYIGYSTQSFRNTTDSGKTSIIDKILDNTGINYNTITLKDSDITYNTGKTFADISQFAVILTDGYQYASQGEFTAFDCESRSTIKTF
jgi:hypothetical protein